MRTLRALVLVCLPLSLLGLAGCKSSCRALTERVCDCKLTTYERTACLQAAAQKEANAPITAEDEAFCEDALPRCDALLDSQGCPVLETEEGKEACGLARE